MQRAYTWFWAVSQLEGANFLAGRYAVLVGWEIFLDESAPCQEKCAVFKYSERRLKEKEWWERREELQGWID